MKIALITDQHFGARGDNQIFDAFFEQFYTNIFFPILTQQNIENVIDLGDTFDRRKFINFNTLLRAKSYYFDRLAKLDIETTILVGNHCTFYKNTNEVNSPSILLQEYKNLDIVVGPRYKRFGDLVVLLLPWICASNQEESLRLIAEKKVTHIMGHLEINGFEMAPGLTVRDIGVKPDLFASYEHVMSGHFHHKADKGNISYLGNPYELTWTDYRDPRGFHIFDTETKELTFIQNPYRMFYKLEYDDRKPFKLPPKEKLKDRYIKVLIVQKKDLLRFDAAMGVLYGCGPADVKIVEDAMEYGNESGEKMDVENAPSILNRYIDNLSTDLDKNHLKDLVQSLYVEAQSLQYEKE